MAKRKMNSNHASGFDIDEHDQCLLKINDLVEDDSSVEQVASKLGITESDLNHFILYD